MVTCQVVPRDSFVAAQHMMHKDLHKWPQNLCKKTLQRWKLCACRPPLPKIQTFTSQINYFTCQLSFKNKHEESFQNWEASRHTSVPQRQIKGIWLFCGVKNIQGLAGPHLVGIRAVTPTERLLLRGDESRQLWGRLRGGRCRRIQGAWVEAACVRVLLFLNALVTEHQVHQVFFFPAGIGGDVAEQQVLTQVPDS